MERGGKSTHFWFCRTGNEKEKRPVEDDDEDEGEGWVALEVRKSGYHQHHQD